MIKAWMPINKDSNGNFVGILSDDSLDRDNEFMTRELLEDWANNTGTLPMLANHENKMEKFVGGWKNKKLISKGKSTALIATPFFFSKEANPLAQQIQKQVEESLDNGLNVGISIGAIVPEEIEKEIDGVKRVGYSKAEIVEATIVPIQSNRNASFTAIAKSFGYGKNNKKLEGEIMGDELKFSQKDYDVAVNKVSKEADEKVAEADVKVAEAEAKVIEAEAKIVEGETATTEAKTEVDTVKAESEEAKAEAEKVLEAEKKTNADLVKEVAKLKKFSDGSKLPNTDVPTGDYSKKGLVNKDAPITFESMLSKQYKAKEGDE